MLQGKCVDTGGSTNLTKGEVYYLFPHGGQAYYASRFPRDGSHFGAYQKNHFELVDVAIDVPAQVLNKYLARVVKSPSHFYRIDEEYIITEPRADGYYSVFLSIVQMVLLLGHINVRIVLSVLCLLKNQQQIRLPF